MALATSSFAENAGAPTVAVQLNTTGPTAAAVTVDVVDLLTGTATEGAGNDYTYTTPTQVTFPAGSVDGATQTVAVTLLDDAVLEPTESVDLRLQNVSGATIVAANRDHQLDITDNDPLRIVKRAFQSDGTPIPSGSTLPSGTPVKFLLYIDNPLPLTADVSMRDVLDPVFLYVAGSIKYDNSVVNCAAATCSVAEEAAIFTAADSGTVGTDPVDGDVVSFAGVTLDIGNQTAANAQLDIAGSSVWAVVFTIRMQ